MSEETFRAAIAAGVALLQDVAVDTALIEASGVFDVMDSVAKAEAVSPHWLIEIPLGDVLEQFAVRKDVSIFYIDEVPGSLFATTERLAPGKSSIVVADGKIGVPVAVTEAVDKSSKKITKIFKTDEERYVLGVVLEPETKDSQGDIYSHAEVRKAAHIFMETAGALGKQHSENVTGKLKILESYIAPVDFTVEDDETVKKGTWLMGIRVVDDDLWTDVKKGEFTGFSIGGDAYRNPE